MTMVRDEADMLPRWVDYYGSQFSPDDLFVIDDNSVDGSTASLPGSLFRMPPAPYAKNWMQTRNELANAFARGLLSTYQTVIFTDVDEFLVPDPAKYEGLRHYLDVHGDADVRAALAVNVLHDQASEGPLDRSRPVLSQRRFVKWVPGMCKPLVKRIPAPWMPGFHGIKAPFAIDTDLLLIHLKYYDAEQLAVVAERRHRLHVDDGRGSSKSSWTLEADEVQRQLTGWVSGAGPETPEFRPDEIDLSNVVRTLDQGFFRSVGQQLLAMDTHPLRALPDRYRDIV